jgi:hypothetical protein
MQHWDMRLLLIKRRHFIRAQRKNFFYFQIENGGKHGEKQRFVEMRSVHGKNLPKKVFKATFAIDASCGILIEEISFQNIGPQGSA